ncbi:hypothetical protein NM688_g127 [Phlebia brevispora]|uniref:Uncharacterized protein n=1 Tax=Phlebia brevispora TaxID=194682 RepID=A0ACC1TFG6_9APHY|nr:hypothetical protein NM688_g127 [Phlebia brevispora]
MRTDLQVIQASGSSVNIEVPRSWRLWSGWGPREWDDLRQEWKEWEDALNDEDFSGAAIFPALKPNENVFHVTLPSYTRKQRGWYRVKPWPPRPPRTVTDGREQGAMGGDVPVELFDIVLNHIAHGEGMADYAIFMSKQELGLISLVCRRWARTLQPHIFRKVTLRSGEDFRTFLSFLRDPHSSIVRYVNTITLSQSVAQYPYMPWIHSVVSVTDQAVRALKKAGNSLHAMSLQVALDGPLPTGKFTKGICEMLPRSVPWSFAAVTMLVLRDLHFKKLGDLVQIPRELPSLRRLDCSNVTWDDPSPQELPPTSQYLSRSAGQQDQMWYTLRGCTDDGAAAWFAALLAPRWRDRLEQSDAHQICRIASAFRQDVDKNKLEESSGFRYDTWLQFLTPAGWVDVYFTDRVARQERRVRAIVLNVTGYSDEVFKCADWDAIDRLTMALPALEALLVYAYSHDDLLHFHQTAVVQKMPNFRGSSKLKYALRSFAGGAPKTWKEINIESKARNVVQQFILAGALGRDRGAGIMLFVTSILPYIYGTRGSLALVLPSSTPSTLVHIPQSLSYPRCRSAVHMAAYSPSYDRLEVARTSETAVEIEVPRSWRLWSGWNPRRWDSHSQTWHEWSDPMDQKGFDEATAFPAVKPDQTIFHIGLPPYTRNPRGRAATGADVPAELFDNILQYMSLPDLSARDRIDVNKRELGQLSLVCRRWADTLRWSIFWKIQLRSGEDTATFLSFLLHPCSRIRDYIIYDLTLSQPLTQYPYAPWTHTVFAYDLSRSMQSGYANMRIVLTGPLPPGKFTKGICEMLPRSVPWSFKFAKITGLELRDLHFRKVEDLLRIPRELPSLQEMECVNVTWDRSPSDKALPASPARASKFSKWSRTTSTMHGRADDAGYALHECTDNAAAALLAALGAQKRRDRLEQNDGRVIYGIASALVRNIDNTRFPEYSARSIRSSDHLDFSADSHDAGGQMTPVMYAYFTPQVAGQTRRVRAVRLDIESSSTPSFDNSDWKSVDTLLTTLPSLETLIISSDSRANMLRFHKEVLAEKMPVFHNSMRLKYALQGYGQPKNGILMQAYTLVSCTEDKVREIDLPVDDIKELL